jgi:hypothetical protein
MVAAFEHPNSSNSSSNFGEANRVDLAELGLQNERSRQTWLECHQAEIESLETVMRQLVQAKGQESMRMDWRQTEPDQIQPEIRYIFDILLNQRESPSE